jgi:hypothetical protein
MSAQFTFAFLRRAAGARWGCSGASELTLIACSAPKQQTVGWGIVPQRVEIVVRNGSLGIGV